MTLQSFAGQDAPKTPVFDTELISEISTPAIAAAASFQRGMVGNIAAFQNEWFGFINSRWQEYLAMPARLATCRSLPEVQQAYMAYWKRALEQYSREYEKLGSIARANGQTDATTTATTAGPARAPDLQRSEPVAARVRLDG